MARKTQAAGAAALGMAMLIGFGLCGAPARAAYTLTLQQTGADVTATGAGSINFDALAWYGDELDTSLLSASDGAILVGPTTPTDDTYYQGIAGPAAAFGAGGEFFADSGGGGMVGLGTFDATSGGVVAVPLGYVSGTDLGTSTAAWTNATLMSLGLTPGIYAWTWGSGASADTFTLDIVGLGATAAPEPATWALTLLGLAGLALARARRPTRSALPEPSACSEQIQDRLSI